MKKIFFILVGFSMLFANTYNENKMLDFLETLSLKCSKGDLKSCKTLDKFTNSINTINNKTNQTTSIKDKCAKGSSTACDKIGDNYIVGKKGYPQSFENALKYYNLACKYGLSTACNKARNAKYLVDYNKNNIKQENKNNYYEGDNTDYYTYFKNNYNQAVRNCKNGDNDLCIQLAWSYNKGINGLPKNINKSIEFARIACENNSSEGCKAVAEISKGTPYRCYSSTPVEKANNAAEVFMAKNEANKARECLEVSCNKNNAKGCRMLGDMYHYSRGAVYNYNTAKNYYAKGCNLGDMRACEEYKKVDFKQKEEEDRNKKYIVIDKK